MEKDGKWRFTSPTHVVLAFAQAMREMEAEGGIEARHQRYTSNNRLLIELMAEMGFVLILTAGIRDQSLPPSSTLKTMRFLLTRCITISRSGDMPFIRER